MERLTCSVIHKQPVQPLCQWLPFWGFSSTRAIYRSSYELYTTALYLPYSSECL